MLGLQFTLHDGERGAHDAAHEQPPVLRLDEAWSAAGLEAAFAARRAEWFADDLAPYADNIAAVLAQERVLSSRWQGLPGTDHPAHWDGAADSLARAQPQRRVAGRLAVWHPPLAWVMPLVRRRARELQVKLPLAGSTAALEAMARAALPPGWQRHTVDVRIDIETRVYWGARSTRHDGRHAWKPCRRRGDGLSHCAELFTLRRGHAVAGTLDGDDLAPLLCRRLAGGVGLMVAIPVLSFERRRRFRQQVGLQLAFEEIVRRSLIDQQIGQSRTIVDQGAGIVFAPRRTVIAQITAKRFLSPRAVQRRHDRRERAGRAEAAGIAQRNRQRAVSAHRMAGDALPAHVDRKFGCDQGRQFLDDVRPHPIVAGEGLLCRIDVETRAETEVVGPGWIVRHAFAARACVRRDEDQAVLRAGGAILAFLGHVCVRAGQA